MGLRLDNPDFTLQGKIPVKEEGVEKVAQGIGRPWCCKAHKVWKAAASSSKERKKEEEGRKPKTRRETIG